MENQLQEKIVLTADNTVFEFKERSQDTLDFSEASLATIEEILNEASSYSEQMKPEMIDDLVNLFSCYILEVARREYGGKYYWHEQVNAPVLVVGEPKYRIAIMTTHKVKNRLLGDVGDNIPFFYRGFAEHISKQETGIDIVYA